MLSESRLKQIAEERQQLMKKEFRDVLKAPTTITCPKVTSKATSAKIRPKSGDLNVASNRTNPNAKSSKPTSTQNRLKSGTLNVASNKPSAAKPQQFHDVDLSSESSHSFLLDCVNERSNNIFDDISRCRQDDNERSQTKIQALHELLNQVNSFRRILCEEVKKNNGDVSRIDTSQYLNEIGKMEEKQQKIMKEKPTEKFSNKRTVDKKQPSQDREQDLKERERLLQLKESCINEKARELYLREKKIKEQKKQSTSTKEKSEAQPKAVVTANGTECLDEIPLRIVINVNKNEQTKENYADVVVNDVKWCDKLTKPSQLKENIQSVPVTNGSGKQYPKTPAAAKAKVVTMERKQVDISSQSSTSITAYLSPPEQIRTQLTEALQQRGILKKPRPQQEESPQVNDAELLQYIIRMLGMSRTSIEQLNMSSVSTVQTPESSVINISSNRRYLSSASSTPITNSSSVSIEQLQSVDKAKLQQLAR